MKQCALLSVGVNYIPDNSYMTYEDSSMVAYSLSLSFQELTPIFNSDYDDLDVNELDGLAIMSDTDNSKMKAIAYYQNIYFSCLLYTSPSPRD